jgi:hypothetical protein
LFDIVPWVAQSHGRGKNNPHFVQHRSPQVYRSPLREGDEKGEGGVQEKRVREKETERKKDRGRVWISGE